MQEIKKTDVSVNAHEVLSNPSNPYYRGLVQPTVTKLLSERKANVRELSDRGESQGNLGSLGPCKFEDVRTFLSRAISDAKAKIIENKTKEVKREYGMIKRKNDLYEGGSFSSVISIGDIHGDLIALLAILLFMKVIDAHGNFTAPPGTCVVLLGDVIDKSGRMDALGESISLDSSHNPREEIDIFQYLYALGNIAKQNGDGDVIILLGNHEIARMLPDLPGYDKYSSYHSKLQELPYDGMFKQTWAVGGLFAQFAAYYWPLILQIDNCVFVHGGVNSKILEQINLPDVASMNQVMSEILLGERKITESASTEALLDVLFDRSLSEVEVNETESNRCVTEVKKTFEFLGINYDLGAIFLSHTVQINGIPYFCAGKVWRQDLRLSEGFGLHTTTPIGAIKITQNAQNTLVAIEQVWSNVLENGSQMKIKKSSKIFKNGHMQCKSMNRLIFRHDVYKK